MKKITGFFLALLPIFVIILMFVSGMIVKGFTHVFVSSVEFSKDNVALQWTIADEEKQIHPGEQLSVRVLPFNASNPEIEFFSSNPDIAEIDQQGKITAVGFGETDVYVVSKENELINAKCTVEVWDNQIHHIAIRNEAEVNYLGFGQRRTIDAVPVPSTHLDEDPTLIYKEVKDEDNVLRVDEVGGEIVANDDGTEGQAKIEVSTSNKERPVTQTLDVRVGVGVSTIDLEDGNATSIVSDTYDLFDDIVVYPENKENISPKDFTYEINHYGNDSNDIAEVSEDGIVTFHQQGTVTVKATYKRNHELSVSKTITSTCNYLSDVSFNRYNYEADISDFSSDPYIKDEDINWRVYPLTDDQSKITISSSNPDVVSVEDNKKLRVHKAGSVTLLATVNVAEGITKQDACNVIIYDESKEIVVKNPSITLNDSYVYNLRDNIDSSSLKTENQHIEWETDSDVAQVNNNNETISFKSSGTASITGKVYDDGGTTPTRQCQFAVTCNYEQEAIVVNVPDVESPVINIQAGKKYKIKTADGTATLWPDFATSRVQDNFYVGDYDTDWSFIPKAGMKVGMLDLYLDPESIIDIPTTVKLIVEQPATGVYPDDNFPFYTTTLSEIAMADYIPSYPNTATDSDGNKILPEYDYKYNESEAFVDTTDNVIQFKQPSLVTINDQYFVKSTFGGIGKFNLKDHTGKIIESGEEVDIWPDDSETKILSVNKDSLFASDIMYDQSLADKFKISSLSNYCDAKVVVDSDAESIEIRITPKDKAYGKDTISIDTGMFVFNLNVNITREIFDFNLFYHDELITDKNNTSYIENLMVNIQPLPLKVGSDPKDLFTVTLNGNDVEVLKGSRAKLNLIDGPNHVTVSSKNSTYSKDFIIMKKDQEEITDFSIVEADSENNVYMGCGTTSMALTIKVDGFVNDEFFEIFDSGIKYTPVGRESCKRSFNKIYIRDVARAIDRAPGFDNSISIALNDQQPKIFNIHRDIISRVVLPNHDNSELIDQKGLQKLHVYGNKSFYTPEEGEIDYYKLPVDIYDYKGNLITDKEKKHDAFMTLKPSMQKPDGTTHSWEYDQQNDLIKIKFDQDPTHLYSEQDVYNNTFEQHQKDVKFTVGTASGFASASYTFVPVEGRNVYCQEGMADCQGRSGDCRKVVLQTNFGLEGTDKDNVPFDQEIWYKFETIYGNGYTINFNAIAELGSEQTQNDIYICNMFNTTCQGCNDKNVKHGADIDLQTWTDGSGYQGEYLFAYNTFKNIPRGLFLYVSPINRVRNCLFYNNYLVSINVNADDNDEAALYIEDCVMFNCSSAAIDQVFGAEVYFKGFVDVYNFRNQDVLSNIMGHDFSFLWEDWIRPALEDAHALQIGADGRPYFNSILLQAMEGNTYFWDGAQYVQSSQGLETAAPHLRHCVDVSLQPIFDFSAGLWGTLNPTDPESGDPTATSYYEEFDKRGNLRWDFLNAQIRKVARPVVPYWVLYLN